MEIDLCNDSKLGIPLRRRRLAGAERRSRVLQVALKKSCERMRATEHAPRGPFRLLEHRHGLAEIIQRGALVPVERQSIIHPLSKIPFFHGTRRSFVAEAVLNLRSHLVSIDEVVVPRGEITDAVYFVVDCSA